METQNLVNLKNWNFAHYNSEHFKAFIGMTGDVEETNGDFKEIILYSVTVVDGEDKEIFQRDFKSLKAAITLINENYSHWQFSDPTDKSGGGCSSCSAH